MNKRKLAATLLISAGLLAADIYILYPKKVLEARNTTVMTHTEKPNVVCGALECHGNNPSGHGPKGVGGGGGGTIHVGG